MPWMSCWKLGSKVGVSGLVGYETLSCTSYEPSEFIVDPAGFLVKKTLGAHDFV